MTIHKIPETIVYICDGCNQKFTYRLDTLLTVSKVLRDFQGGSVAGSEIKKDLCDDCSTIVIESINEAINKIRVVK